MTNRRGIWGRWREEVRSVADNTRRSARRAFDAGVLRVDLVSLHRERRRALADLGERMLTLWNRERLDAVEQDSEMIRLRSRVDGIDAAIAEKEAASRRLRDASAESPVTPARAGSTPES